MPIRYTPRSTYPSALFLEVFAPYHLNQVVDPLQDASLHDAPLQGANPNQVQGPPIDYPLNAGIAEEETNAGADHHGNDRYHEYSYEDRDEDEETDSDMEDDLENGFDEDEDEDEEGIYRQLIRD